MTHLKQSFWVTLVVAAVLGLSEASFTVSSYKKVFYPGNVWPSLVFQSFKTTFGDLWVVLFTNCLIFNRKRVIWVTFWLKW